MIWLAFASGIVTGIFLGIFLLEAVRALGASKALSARKADSFPDDL